ncbi:hypothetical protein F2P81_017536 [Scophthalmus maximus]|uniref:Uncharacterized protein n=1 Tax=Scophthalmus maximus TaxID=52904 RepID=A0A6A4SE58_SCOMX|nr:hypothetical protein F2P81_017536 [Scophthalmus maximus]
MSYRQSCRTDDVGHVLRSKRNFSVEPFADPDNMCFSLFLRPEVQVTTVRTDKREASFYVLCTSVPTNNRQPLTNLCFDTIHLY